jgi:hypothetical protein
MLNTTRKTLTRALERAEELGVKTIVVATTTGRTAVSVCEMFQDHNVVAVTHSTGFSESDTQELEPANLETLRAYKAHVLTTTHAFGGVGRAIRRKLNTFQVDEIMAQTLRIFGQGTKVAVEITLMAADAGLVSVAEEVIAIGGTGKGADTALLIKPANAQDFFDLKVREIISKPR